MSCPDPSKSTKKRKLDKLGECEKPASKKMAWDSYSSIKDFGYKFNEEGRLVDIDSGDGFNFQVDDDHSYNQKNYEMLGEVITEYIYTLLQSESVGLKKIEIPQTKESSSILPFGKQKKSKDVIAKGFIFASENFEQKEKLLVLVHGSGVVRAGQWARRLIINDCLDHGTQIPYITQAINDGYGVVVLNTNQDEVLVEIDGKKTYKTIKESESPERHFSYVWKNIIEKTVASKIFIVAHSYGGYLVVNYFSRYPKTLERVIAVAFTDSVHSLNYESKGDVRKWFLENSVNWVTSNEDLDTRMSHQDDRNHVTRVSAGTQKHEETSWKAMESVFKYFQKQELDFDKQGNAKNIKKKGKTGKGNKNHPKDKTPEEDNKSASMTNVKVTKKLYSKAHIPVGCGHEQKCGNGSEQDGMNEYVEVGQEPSENREDTGGERESKNGHVIDKTNSKKPTVASTFVGSTTTKKNEATKPDEIEKDIKEEDKPSKVHYLGGTSVEFTDAGESVEQPKESPGSEAKEIDKDSSKIEDNPSSTSVEQPKDSPDSETKEIDKDSSKIEDDPSSTNLEQPKDSPGSEAKEIDTDSSKTEDDLSSTSVEQPKDSPGSEAKEINKDSSKTEDDPSSTSVEQPKDSPGSEAKEIDKDSSKTEDDPSSTSVEQPKDSPGSEAKEIDKDPSNKENDPSNASEEKPEKTPDSEGNKISKNPSKTENDPSSTSEEQSERTPVSEANAIDKDSSKIENDSISTSEIKHGENSELASNIDKDPSKTEIGLSSTTDQHGEKPDEKLDDSAIQDNVNKKSPSIKETTNDDEENGGDACATDNVSNEGDSRNDGRSKL